MRQLAARCAAVLVNLSAGLALAACVSTSRVDETVTTSALATQKKAVAVMRIGTASPSCVHVGVLLGTREGPGFRRQQVLKVANVRSLSEALAAEVELAPGEYHVIGYSCVGERGPSVVTDKSDGELYRRSYASFTLAAGEVVNVGYLHFHASRHGLNAFGRPLRITVEVTDWPVAELERFKQRRPQVYALMTTRLMRITPAGPLPPDADDCTRMRELQAAGKLQELPPACRPAQASQRKI